MESKDKMEKLMVTNSISFFIEWQEKRLWDRLFHEIRPEKSVFTIRINEADSVLAKDLVEGMDSVKLGVV